MEQRMELDSLEEHIDHIKNLAAAMIDLAIADYIGVRGGPNSAIWKRSAESWMHTVMPGDDCNPATFLGACTVLGIDYRRIRDGIKRMNRAHRASHYVSDKRGYEKINRTRTYSRGCARKEWQCEYCGEWIRTGEVHYYRHITGRALRGHLKCVDSDKIRPIKIKEGYVCRKDRIERSRLLQEAK